MPYHGIEADERTGITGLLVSTDFCCAVVSRLDTKSVKEHRNVCKAKRYTQFMIKHRQILLQTLSSKRHRTLSHSDKPIKITQIHNQHTFFIGVSGFVSWSVSYHS